MLSVEHTAVILAQRDGIVTGLYAEEGARRQGPSWHSSTTHLRIHLQEATPRSPPLVEEQQYQAQAQLNRSELDQNKRS